jgi:prolyl-tRNA editing enzyme YbaK/EbsC (Cys-tRNA(Pro) deacylase)
MGHDGSLARLVLMHDKDGKVLALLPATTLLNLANVWKLTGRQLQPVKGADAERFFSQDAVQSQNGFRKLATLPLLPLLVDERCLQYPTLQVNEPYSKTTWEVAASLLSDASHGKLATDADEIALQAPQGDDETVITSAVKKFTKLRIQQRLEDTLGLPSMSPTTQKNSDAAL